MDTSKQASSQPARTYEPLTPIEDLEQDASYAGLAVGTAARGLEIAGAVLLALILCPPLLILVVVVVVPLVVTVLVVSLAAAVLATPFVLVRHLRGHRSAHSVVFVERVRHAAHAIHDVLPHRVINGARDVRRG